MKYIKYIIIVIFLAATITYVINWAYTKSHTNESAPVISVDNAGQVKKVSVKDKDALLKGVVAKDSKDGDITSRLVVESISKFVDKKNHICNITYAVANSRGVVTKATRKIQFTDYKKPRLVLSQSLCFDTGTDVDVKSVIGATDVFDGDISRKVKILSKDISTNISGDNTITAQVTNSLGDTVKLKAVVVIKQDNNLSPVIKLSQNIVYTKVGESFNPKKCIQSVEDNRGKAISKNNVRVTSSSVKTKKAGCYLVEYSVKDLSGNEGTAYLTVMVEE